MRLSHLCLALSLAAGCAADPADPAGPGHGGGKADDVGESEDVMAAVRANLERVSAEIDPFHLDTYGLDGTTAERFLAALELEYADQPAQLHARLRALASMIFFAAPDIAPPEGGNVTPFHGLDMGQFDDLMDLEDSVWNELARQNGSVVGVRPFSVCETRFMIETYVRPHVAYPGFDDYKTAYADFAATCPERDLAEWYNFRGLGHLRPSWVESNYMDRILRRNLRQCKNPSGTWEDECAEFEADRLGYRLDRNRQFAGRFLFFTDEQKPLVTDTKNEVLIVDDRNGDGVAEVIGNGPAKLTSGDDVTLELRSTGEFSGTLKARRSSGSQFSVHVGDVVADEAVAPGFDPLELDQPDFGLLDLFADGAGCSDDPARPDTCALLERFYTLIDRHEDFYQTYTSSRPTSSFLSSQPSPLVACSITLAASHAWDSAGTPSGGSAGFIFLMRIPFDQILAGTPKSVATLEPGPEVTSIQSLYQGKQLDMSRVWLDIASLSHNLFQSEHEISKFGSVPAEQIEGILVVRKPANLE